MVVFRSNIVRKKQGYTAGDRRMSTVLYRSGLHLEGGGFLVDQRLTRLLRGLTKSLGWKLELAWELK
jgi:hypothetical protein